VQKLYYNTTPRNYKLEVEINIYNKNNFCQHSRSDKNLHFYYLYLYSNTVASTTRTHSVALVVTLRVGYYHLVYLSTYIS